jgi:hypothetical protein
MECNIQIQGMKALVVANMGEKTIQIQGMKALVVDNMGDKTCLDVGIAEDVPKADDPPAPNAGPGGAGAGGPGGAIGGAAGALLDSGPGMGSILI